MSVIEICTYVFQIAVKRKYYTRKHTGKFNLPPKVGGFLCDESLAYICVTRHTVCKDAYGAWSLTPAPNGGRFFHSAKYAPKLDTAFQNLFLHIG